MSTVDATTWVADPAHQTSRMVSIECRQTVRDSSRHCSSMRGVRHWLKLVRYGQTSAPSSKRIIELSVYGHRCREDIERSSFRSNVIVSFGCGCAVSAKWFQV